MILKPSFRYPVEKIWMELPDRFTALGRQWEQLARVTFEIAANLSQFF